MYNKDYEMYKNNTRVQIFNTVVTGDAKHLDKWQPGEDMVPVSYTVERNDYRDKSRNFHKEFRFLADALRTAKNNKVPKVIRHERNFPNNAYRNPQEYEWAHKDRVRVEFFVDTRR